MNIDAISLPVARDLVAMARRHAAEREALMISLKAHLPHEQHTIVAQMLSAITKEVEKEVVARLVVAHRDL